MVDQCAWDMLNNSESFLVKTDGELAPEAERWFRTGGAFMMETMARLLRYQLQETAIIDPSKSTGCLYHGYEPDEICPLQQAEDQENEEEACI